MLLSGNMAEGRAHLDQLRFLILSKPADGDALWPDMAGAIILIWRSLAQWVLGYPDAALASAEQAVGDAREMGYASTLMHMLSIACLSQL